MNGKRMWLVLFLLSVVVGIVFAQRSDNPGVSATLTTQPGVGRAKFYNAEVRNANPYAVNVEIFYSAVSEGAANRHPNAINLPQSTRVSVPAKQTKSVPLTSGTDLRVRIVELKVKSLQ